MTVLFSEGSPDHVLTEEHMREAVRAAIARAEDPSRMLVLPPDGTRVHSGAGALTRILYEESRNAERFDVMPAIGTHFPMDARELRAMFGDQIPLSAYLEHNWRSGLRRFGVVPADVVHEVSQGVLRASMPDYDIPVEVSERVADGGYGAIISVGQVLPHEVAGMANGFKNVLVGTGGQETINKSHFLGAAYGMERMMGCARNPVRDVFNYAHDHFLAPLRIVYILTVMEQVGAGEVAMRGIFVGDGLEAFQQAAALSLQVNVVLVDGPQHKVVAHLDPSEFKSTWLGNKAIYRTRMMMADGGELLVIAPGVRAFGEDPEIDRLVRRYGFRGTPEILRAARENADLAANLSAAAHLIHGSSEGRFRVVYATDPELLSREEVEGVGFEWMHIGDALRQYPVDELADGPQDGFYYVSRPALGLWAERARFAT
jgi:nickel-dependent lactate racemase